MSSNISLVNTLILMVLVGGRSKSQQAPERGCLESSMLSVSCITTNIAKRAGSCQDSSLEVRGTESGVQISPPMPSTMHSDVWGKPHPFEFSVPTRTDLATSREGLWDYRGEVENYSAPRRRLEGLDASYVGVYYGPSIVGELDVVGFDLRSIICTHWPLDIYKDARHRDISMRPAASVVGLLYIHRRTGCESRRIQTSKSSSLPLPPEKDVSRVTSSYKDMQR